MLGRRWRSFSTTAFSLDLVSAMKHNWRMIAMPENNWISTTEAANLLGCSRAHISWLVKKEYLVGEKINPRCWMIEKKSAQDLAKTPMETGRPRKNSSFSPE